MFFEVSYFGMLFTRYNNISRRMGLVSVYDIINENELLTLLTL